MSSNSLNQGPFKEIPDITYVESIPNIAVSSDSNIKFTIKENTDMYAPEQAEFRLNVSVSGTDATTPFVDNNVNSLASGYVISDELFSGISYQK